MASIVYSNSNALLNPTTNYLPIKGSNKFEDSMLVQNDTNNLTCFDSNIEQDNGLSIDNNIGNYKFGDYSNLINSQSITFGATGYVLLMAKRGITLSMTDANPTLGITGNVTSATAGGSAGMHLALKINGIAYKIQLFYP